MTESTKNPKIDKGWSVLPDSLFLVYLGYVTRPEILHTIGSINYKYI